MLYTIFFLHNIILWNCFVQLFNVAVWTRVLMAVTTDPHTQRDRAPLERMDTKETSFEI